jgi:hypothetical protein
MAIVMSTLVIRHRTNRLFMGLQTGRAVAESAFFGPPGVAQNAIYVGALTRSQAYKGTRTNEQLYVGTRILFLT